jgi:hypothetical protein
MTPRAAKQKRNEQGSVVVRRAPEGKRTAISGMAVAPKRPAARPAISTSSHACALPIRTATGHLPESGNYHAGRIASAVDAVRCAMEGNRPASGRATGSRLCLQERTSSARPVRSEKCQTGSRPHSITSSARNRNDSGIFKPSALAVFRLMTRSNLVGCWTGKSAGFAPRKILSTKLAARRNSSVTFAP